MKINTDKFNLLSELLQRRILILDGAMGTMIKELDCHCEAHDKEGHAVGDIMVRERPEIVLEIHRRYLEAGADIIETNSFNCNAFSLSDYGLQDSAYDLSVKAAELAKKAAEEYTYLNPEKPRFVAGSVGPSKLMLSLADQVDLNFDRFVEVFKTQISGLLDGGADIILLETVFDTLNAKAALYAVDLLEKERKEKIPVMASATVATEAGNLLSGQSIEAFYASVSHGPLLSVGLNCGFGPESMVPFLKRLDAVADVAVSVYPNAGLPDECGCYSQTPELFAKNVENYLRQNLVNIIGGCCGTTPAHIKAIADLASKYEPRVIPEKRKSLVLSNLDYSDLKSREGLVHVGERTNVAGSRKFARMIREKNFDEALDIALRQVRSGARIIDVCMDDGLEESEGNMMRFLKMINSDPEIGKIPVMIDSSDWQLIVSALKVSPGKSIVNSISLKEGEADFLEKAREIKRLGAAFVVMLFDEKGQADTFERKIEIAERAYRLLVDNGIDPVDIIFDPNVLTVGTGMIEEDKMALDFIRATEWIKANLPGVSVSGGISNLSFAFRGNNTVREAMHTAFLYHAGKAGLDMAIVNSEMLALYRDIPQELLQAVEDLILCRKKCAAESLTKIALSLHEKKDKGIEEIQPPQPTTLNDRIKNALIKGKDSFISEYILQALETLSPIEIIECYLMPVMEEVGIYFRDGRMFLPQVIKTAQVMHKAVETLSPYLNRKNHRDIRGKVILATVKGDVHDIGKNIVGLVTSCNGFEVLDLGVRVDCETIVARAMEHKPKAVLLSGLIAPSLNEMVKVCECLENKGLQCPVIVGGAATSEMHTAVKIAPVYSGPVFYSSDASENLKILNRLISDEAGQFIQDNYLRQRQLCDAFERGRIKSKNNPDVTTFFKKSDSDIVLPRKIGRLVFDDLAISDIEQLIDWNYLLTSLDLKKKKNNIDNDSGLMLEEAALKDARALLARIKNEKLLRLQGVVEIFPAQGVGDDILVKTENNKTVILPMLRGSNPLEKYHCVADLVAQEGDSIALFAVTAGIGLDDLIRSFEEKGDFYSAVLAKLIADRLAEAFALYIHKLTGEKLWGFFDNDIQVNEINEKKIPGVRIAFGYPAAPDHSLKKDVFRLLDVENVTGMTLTENFMISPGESVCGLILSHGDYFNIGRINSERIENYAQRRGLSLEEIRHLIPNNIE